MARERVDSLAWLRKQVKAADKDLLREMVKGMLETLMSAEVDAVCGAPYRTPSTERVNHRNGYHERRWDTRVGTIDLAIPRVRKGSYFPEWLLEQRRRSERAVVQVVTESYVRGVSTRRVDGLVCKLSLRGMSKSKVSELAKELGSLMEGFRNRPLDAGPYTFVWLDAMTQRCREGGHVVTVIAAGVNSDAYQEILGVDVFTSEDGAGWSSFLRNLVKRGLSGVKLVISDAHSRLKAAIAEQLPGSAWQRCRTHFISNLLNKVPRSAQDVVATMVRSIFAQPTEEEVWEQYKRVVDHLEDLFPAVAKMLSEAGDEILPFSVFPKSIWRQIWSNNPQERLNRELRRRSGVVGIFPNGDAIIRLVGAVLAEQNDEWMISRRYMSLRVIQQTQAVCDWKEENELNKVNAEEGTMLTEPLSV